MQGLSNAANKGVFLLFVLCGLVYVQTVYSSVNQLQLLLRIRLQPGLENLRLMLYERLRQSNDNLKINVLNCDAG